MTGLLHFSDHGNQSGYDIEKPTDRSRSTCHLCTDTGTKEEFDEPLKRPADRVRLFQLLAAFIADAVFVAVKVPQRGKLLTALRITADGAGQDHGLPELRTGGRLAR